MIFFRYLRFLLLVLWHTHRLAARGDPKSAVWLFGRLCSAVEFQRWKDPGRPVPQKILRLHGALWDAMVTFHSTHVLDESFHVSKEPTHASDSSDATARPE